MPLILGRDTMQVKVMEVMAASEVGVGHKGRSRRSAAVEVDGNRAVAEDFQGVEEGADDGEAGIGGDGDDEIACTIGDAAELPHDGLRVPACRREDIEM